MIPTLLFTVLAEGVVALGYCVWQKKPVLAVLVTSVCANVGTQYMLWGVLNLFFSHYLVVLLIVEILIWWVESLALYIVPANRLKFRDALGLSLSMNLISFGLGWFLPL